jgi:heme-degrading monooxygenase HmoA
MFVAVRRYQVRRGATAEWAKRVQDGFVPMMRGMEGFRGYYLASGGPDAVITISMFDSADQALLSNERPPTGSETTFWSSPGESRR